MAYLGRTDVGIIDFTGQHRCFIKDVPFSQANDLEGLIVSSDQNKYIKINNGIETGSNAILINESLPVVSLSNTVMDKKCFGVISASEDPEERSDAFGKFVSVAEKEKGDTRVYINSVGEGAIWVVNTNGSLESGDYITTSNVAGYGQKQDSEFLANYTVAKITMDCDFEPATQPVQQILRSNVVQTYYLGDVHHVKSVPYEIITTEEGESNVVYETKYTLTTTANVTESDPWDNVFIDPPEVTYTEYSNLEANVQSTYTLTFTQTTTDEKTPTEWSALESNVQSLYNKVYYQSVEEEVAADYPGAVAHTRVTDQIENTLDEYGQIQWEDHPTKTEKAYKVRYLTADGTQTDEANAVHIAAFVGCTYHCG
jgi:3D (Asp-Asp-Asp) domain-containing protein